MRTLVALAAFALVAATAVVAVAPTSTAQTVSPVSSTPAGPIFNPTFEIGPRESPVSQALDDSPADHCFGVGHQVFWGSETPQGEATGGQLNPYALDPSGLPDPSEADPQAAADSVQDDPEGEAMFLAGQGECVYGDDTGYDLAWVQPADRSEQPAHWSMDPQNPSVDWGTTYDDDPMDREAVFTTDGEGAHHNMWQWFGSPHQAWTPNAEALTLTLEQGDAPSNAAIKVSLSTIPDESTGPGGYYVACQLTFTGDLVNANADADGNVAVSPLDADLNARHSSCDSLEAQFDGGTDAEKRDALGETRITQVSFWGWNQASTPVVVDDIQLEGATTYAEDAALDAAPSP